MVTAAILAAGTSRRMGRPKLLLPWRDTTILGTTIANVRASDVDSVLIITGAYQTAVTAIAAQYAVPAVHNPHHATGGMLSSLQTAVRHTAPDSDSLLVMMGDMPLITAATINLLLEAHQPAAITAPVVAGTRGHPVIFGRAFFRPILDLPSTATPRTILQQHPAALHRVPVTTEAILIDIDTPELYEKYRPI